MARTLVLDGLRVKRMAIVRGRTGQWEAHVEYDVQAGGKTVQTKVAQLSSQQTAARQAVFAALMDGLGQELAATELV
jgi:uncharacterized protein with beta-barrel porin domain